MKFTVTFHISWENDSELVDFEFDSKNLESLHLNIKTAIDEGYLQPELEIKRSITGKMKVRYVLIKDSLGKELYQD
jgi:hypothetical protein|tara:strand:+ start:2039 stop:2266 length:228 start_codon:yes stop_codon:yes gene_type:complete